MILYAWHGVGSWGEGIADLAHGARYCGIYNVLRKAQALRSRLGVTHKV